MENPLGYTQAEAQDIFDNSIDFADLLDALEYDLYDRPLTAEVVSAH
jgi:hypothetical protein